MRRYVIILPFAVALTAITFFLITVQPASARWHFWDCSGIDVQNVCRDGMYFALGWSCSIEEDPGPAYATGTVNRDSTGELLFSFSEDLPEQQMPYPNRLDVTHYDYYVRLWQNGNLTLNPGEQVNVLTESDYSYTVQDCSVLPEEPPASTAFSYQGMLSDGNVPADGLYDLQFTLWNAYTGGTMVGGAVTASDVSVESGHFTVQLDFGQDAFNGSARWLAMSVRPGDSTGAYTPLTPRQELLSVPYATGLVAGAVISDAVPGPALAVHNDLGNVLEISGGKYGLVVGSVMTDGLVIQKPGQDGIVVNSPGNDGVLIDEAGGDGVEISQPGSDAVRINSAGDDGVEISFATDDGVYIASTGDDAINIQNAGFWGMYIGSSQYSGIWIEDAGSYGVYANTNITNGYGIYTPDRIYGSNVTASSLSLVAQVTGTETLQRGDVVSAAGVATLNEDGNQLLPQVVRADATGGAGVLGVVESRLTLARAQSGEDEAARAAIVGDGPAGWHLLPEEGPARAGDYVSLIIYGVTYVRLEAGAPLEPGMRLTPADTAGTVRPLRTETIQGMTVTEGTPVIGVLLDAPDAGSGLAPVFVTVR